MSAVKKVLKNMLGPKSPKLGLNPNMTTKQFRKKLGPKADFDGDGVPNWKDCRPLDKYRDMVKYSYYEAEDKEGDKDIVYARSKKEVRHIGDQRHKEYVEVRELPYIEAKEKLKEADRAKTRYKDKSLHFRHLKK